MREYDDMDSNLWEFYVLGLEQYRYRVVDVNVPTPGLESTTVEAGAKYWSGVTIPEEVTVTFRETANGSIFSLMWVWQNEIYDFKNKVFRTSTGRNTDYSGGKKDGKLIIQQPKFGGLLNFARIKLLQEVQPGVGGTGRQIASYGSQVAQIADALSGGTISDQVEQLLYNNVIEFTLKGMRPKKIADMSMSYGQTEGRDIQITYLIDDLEVDTSKLLGKGEQFLIGNIKRSSALL